MVLAQISVFSKHSYTWKAQFISFPKFCPTSLGAGEEWIYEIQRHPSRRQRDLGWEGASLARLSNVGCNLKSSLLTELWRCPKQWDQTRTKTEYYQESMQYCKRSLFSKQSAAESQCDTKVQPMQWEIPTWAKTVSNGETSVTTLDQLDLLT